MIGKTLFPECIGPAPPATPERALPIAPKRLPNKDPRPPKKEDTVSEIRDGGARSPTFDGPSFMSCSVSSSSSSSSSFFFVVVVVVVVVVEVVVVVVLVVVVWTVVGGGVVAVWGLVVVGKVSVVVGVVAAVEGVLVVVAWPVVVSGVVERGTDVELGGAEVVVKGAEVETGGVEAVVGAAEVVEMSGGQLHLPSDLELTSG